MKLAEGAEEVLALSEGFASPEAAARFWNEGVAQAPYEDFSYPGGSGQAQAARLYRGGGAAGTLVYLHGGGWVEGSIALHQPSAAGMALQSGWDVLSISYRLAPAHPYPAALEDCRAALAWLRGGGAGPEAALERIVLGGASAGANLALAAALEQEGLAGLLLYYGVFGDDFDSPSYRRFAEGPGLTRAQMQGYFAQYDPENQRDSRVVPLRAALEGLPPSLIIAAEIDVLLSENEAMAEALRGAGVECTLHVEPGAIHGFINRGRLMPSAERCIARAGAFLREIGGG